MHSSTDMLEAQTRGDAHRQIYLIFLIGTPLVLGGITGWMQSGRSADWQLWQSLYYWVVFFLSGWVVFELTTYILARLIRFQRWSLFMLLAAGGLVGAQLGFPLSYIHVNLCEVWFGGGDDFLSFFEPTLFQHIVRMVDNTAPGMIMWIGVNYAFFYFVGLPRFGFVPPEHLPWQARLHPLIELDERSGLLAKIKRELGTDVWALKAERHYLRVFTALGSDFVLYKLSDGIAELADRGGLQVHRSYWVKCDAIDHVEKHDRSFTLVLSNGLTVPVGRTFRKLVEDRVAAGARTT